MAIDAGQHVLCPYAETEHRAAKGADMLRSFASRVRSAALAFTGDERRDTSGWPRLLEVPERPEFVNSSRRINRLQSGMKRCTTYLEVGVQFGYTFRDVRAPFKWGVDPAQHFYLEDMPPGVRFSLETSDAFFDALPDNVAFDLVFLDGLHEWTQTYRDLLNALNHTANDAIIVIDDVVPDDEYSAIPDIDAAYRCKREAGSSNLRWQGDVYKILLVLADHHPELAVVLTGTAEPGDNPQALVWRRPGKTLRYEPSVVSQYRAEYGERTYNDILGDDESRRLLQTMDEEQAIREALAGSALASRHPNGT